MACTAVTVRLPALDAAVVLAVTGEKPLAVPTGKVNELAAGVTGEKPSPVPAGKEPAPAYSFVIVPVT